MVLTACDGNGTVYCVWPKFHLARHVTTRHVRRVDRVDERVERVEQFCSNMADDEQAIALACTSLVAFMLLHTQILFFPSNEIN